LTRPGYGVEATPSDQSLALLAKRNASRAKRNAVLAKKNQEKI
jgi:hypothetical protein